MYYTLIQYEHCLWNWSSKYYYMSLLVIHSLLILHTLTKTMYLLNWQLYVLLIFEIIAENASTWDLYAPERVSNLLTLFLNMNFVWDRMWANNNDINQQHFSSNQIWNQSLWHPVWAIFDTYNLYCILQVYGAMNFLSNISNSSIDAVWFLRQHVIFW